MPFYPVFCNKSCEEVFWLDHAEVFLHFRPIHLLFISGFVLLAVTFAYFPFAAVLGPAYSRITDGIFMIPALMALYLIRKPGAGQRDVFRGGEHLPAEQQ